jgi:glutamate/aspartate transport system substrate-binding protein
MGRAAMKARAATALFAFAVAAWFLPPKASIAENADPGYAVEAERERVPMDTLEKAKMRGTLIIGYLINNVPFSYQNSTHQPTGYAKDLCDMVVSAVKDEFGLHDLDVIYQPMISQNRIPMLRSGMIDLECSSTTITAEREKIVDFSIPYFISNARLLTRKAYRIRQLHDLANKAIVFTMGTTAENIIAEKLDVKRDNITVLRGRSHPDSFLMVGTGQAAAYVLDDILLAGLIANARDPNAYEIVGPSLSSEHYAVMMRKENGPLKAAVNKALLGIIASGKIKELYERWFMRPIPPSGANMNLPMSDELRQFFDRLASTYEGATAPVQEAKP